MQFSLAQGHHVTTMLAVALVAIGLTGFFYYRAFAALKPAQRSTLFAIRTAAIVLVVALLFRPVLTYPNVFIEKPVLIFLLDASRSMSIADDASGRTRFDQARTKLEAWHETLKGLFRVVLISFADRAEPLRDASVLPSLSPTGEATSLSQAILTAAKQFAPGEVAAVLLLSDGIHNSTGQPQEIARKSGLTIHTVGVGDSLRNNRDFRDVQVVGIACPATLMLGNMAKVTASIDALGLGGHVVQVRCEEDGQLVAETELILDDLEGPQQVHFDFRPMVKGRHTYTVRVNAVNEERILQNNQRSAIATVREASLRVLYLEGTLRAEYGALVDRFLAKDPDLEFCALVQTKPNVFLRRTNMASLQLDAIPTAQEAFDRFDVFILGDIDASYFRPAQQQMLLRRIREGAGVVMLGGYHSLGPGGYADTPLGNVLPVVLGGRDSGQFTKPFLPVLTPDGVRHPIFANIADYFPTRQASPQAPGLPLLEGCTRVGTARPAATVLATVSPEAGAMPVLAVQPVGRGRSAVWTADTTRKWQQGAEASEQNSPFLQFWGQMVRWLAGRNESVDAAAGIVAETDKPAYEPGDPMRLSAIVRDNQGRGVPRAAVSVNVIGPKREAEKVLLSPVPGPVGHYAGLFQPRRAGDYEMNFLAQFDETTLTAPKILVEVGRRNLEFERLDLDDTMLAGIASASGGRYVPLATADSLIQQFDRTQKRKTVLVEQPLYWPPGFWILFVAALTAEWTLRRRYQLR